MLMLVDVFFKVEANVEYMASRRLHASNLSNRNEDEVGYNP